MAKIRCTAYTRHLCMNHDAEKTPLICCHSCIDYDICSIRCENKPRSCNKSEVVDDDFHLYTPSSTDRKQDKKKRIGKFDAETGELLEKYNSISEAARMIDNKSAKSTMASKISAVSACARGKHNTAYGYVWRFLDEGRKEI